MHIICRNGDVTQDELACRYVLAQQSLRQGTNSPSFTLHSDTSILLKNADDGELHSWGQHCYHGKIKPRSSD